MTAAIETISLMCTDKDDVFHHQYNLRTLTPDQRDRLRGQLYCRHILPKWSGSLTLVGHESTRVSLGRTIYSFYHVWGNVVVHMREKDFFKMLKKCRVESGTVDGSWELKPCEGTYFLHWSEPGGDA